MFGFLPGPALCCAKAAACYRAHFCGLCNVLRHDYGLWARGLINRDSTFLALLGASLGPEMPATTPATCCNPWAAPRDLFQSGATVRYAGAVTLCGLTAKLDDDAEDESGPRRWLAVVGRRALDESTAKAVGLLHSLDFPVGGVMRSLREDSTQGGAALTLEEAARPTCHAYGEIVAHPGRLAGLEASMVKALRDIGAHLGFLIYAQDAWEDWEQDRRRGRFNPLHSFPKLEERRAALLPPVTQALASLRSSFGTLTLHRNRDLLSSMLVEGSEDSVQRLFHIKKVKGEHDDERRKKRRCCENCDVGCDCCPVRACRSPSKGGGGEVCDCNPCDGDGCDCCGCDCGW
jgi:hypothetical protein